MGHLIIFSNLDICCRLVSVKVCGERRWLGIVSIKEVGDTSDRGGGLEEWEGGTYAILIVPNRLLSHRHLHHMGQNYPLSMDGSATFHRHSGCQNFTTISAAAMLGQTQRAKIQNVMQWRLPLAEGNIFRFKCDFSHIKIYDSFRRDQNLQQQQKKPKALVNIPHPHHRRCGCAK